MDNPGYGSEQSRMNPQLRQISLQCTSSIGKPQMSQRSPSGGVPDRSGYLVPILRGSLVRTSRLIAAPLPTSKDGIILPQPGDDFHRGEGTRYAEKDDRGLKAAQPARTTPCMAWPFRLHWNG